MRKAAAAFSAAAHSGDEAALEAGLTALCAGLLERSPINQQDGFSTASDRHDVASLPPSPAHLKLLRMLFMCMVLLLDVACSSVPAQLMVRYAATVADGLSTIALGAVAVPQLAALECSLLDYLAQSGELRPLLLNLCISSCTFSTPLRRNGELCLFQWRSRLCMTATRRQSDLTGRLANGSIGICQRLPPCSRVAHLDSAGPPLLSHRHHSRRCCGARSPACCVPLHIYARQISMRTDRLWRAWSARLWVDWPLRSPSSERQQSRSSKA